MRNLILVLGLFLMSCNNKNLIDSEILFEIQNKKLSNNNVLEFKIINKSNNNYFFCLDTKSIYFDRGLNYEQNEFIHPIPIFYLNNQAIELGYAVDRTIKPMSLDTAHYNCVKKNIEYNRKILEDISKLKKTILLKSKTSILLKLPFDNSQIWCDQVYTYVRSEKSGFVQFKYRMNKEYFDRIVDKKLLLQLQQKKYKPYFKEIVSNKVPFILK